MEDKQAKEVGIAKVVQSLVEWFLDKCTQNGNASRSSSNENEQCNTDIPNTNTNLDTSWIFSSIFRASEIFIHNEDVQFGFSRRCYPYNAPSPEVYWSPPEFFSSDQTQSLSDADKACVWCIGIITYELCFNSTPFHDEFPHTVITKLKDPNEAITFSVDNSTYSQYLKSLIEECLNKDPTKRPSLAQLKNHPVISSYSKFEDFVLLGQDEPIIQIPEETGYSANTKPPKEEKRESDISYSITLRRIQFVYTTFSQLLVAIQDTDKGIPLKNRYGSSSVCFSGSDAVDWLVTQCKVTRVQASYIADTLLYRGFIKNSQRAAFFEDAKDVHYEIDKELMRKGKSDLSWTGASGFPEWLMTLSDIEMEEITKRMMHAQMGVNIKTRKSFFKTHENCFVGSEAVTWMLAAYPFLHTRENAVLLGQLLQKRGILHHVTDAYDFLDKNQFYRFRKDDRREKHSSTMFDIFRSEDLDVDEQEEDWRAQLVAFVATNDVKVIPSNQIKMSKKIGSGGYGEVFYGKYAGTDVAVKQMYSVNNDCFLDEIQVLSKLSHPNVVLFMGICIDSPNPLIITEYMSGGSVFDLLHKSTITLSWEILLVMAIDCCKGMAYLHSYNPPIVHRDLKSQNLLLTNHFSVKLCDFGLAKRSNQGAFSQVGTLQWLAPEVIRGEGAYSKKADVYSFGVILWEMATREAPFAGRDVISVASAVGYKGERLKIPAYVPKRIAKLIALCIHDNPNRRPSFQDILTIFESIDAKELTHEQSQLKGQNLVRSSQ